MNEAEAVFARLKTGEATPANNEPAISETRSLPDSDGESIEEADEEVIPHDPILYPLIDEWQLGIAQTTQSAAPKSAATNNGLERINEEARP